MPDEKAIAKPAARAGTSIHLPRRTRVWCLVGGSTTAIFAGIVLWRAVDGAATVAFVALAALLLLLGIAGVVPRRIKSGDHEVELTRDEAVRAVTEVADTATASMTPEESDKYGRDLALSAADDRTGLKSIASSRAQESAEFERRVGHYLEAAFPTMTRNTKPDSNVDYLVMNGVTQVAVQTKLTFSADAPWLWQDWLDLEHGRYSAVIVVVKGLASARAAQEALDKLGGKMAVCNDDPATITWLVGYFLGRKVPQLHLNPVIASSVLLEMSRHLNT